MLCIASKTSCVKRLGDLVKTRRFTFYACNTQYDEVSTNEVRKFYLSTHRDNQDVDSPNVSDTLRFTHYQSRDPIVYVCSLRAGR
jgi:hypothetical protein